MNADPWAARGAHYEVVVDHDVRIPTDTPSRTLAADVYRPVTESPVPALVAVLPYRKDLGDVSELLSWFAARGYAGIFVDLQGTGSSDGPQRPPCHQDDGEDGAAAIGWAAGQTWCTGAVGMWGHSYGAGTTLRTAGRRPPALRAILPLMGMLDPERDFVHPYGLRGGLGSLGWWGLGTMLFQLLPPFRDHSSADEQRRWRERLHAEPWLVDLFRHGPGDPVWRERVIDIDAVCVPALFIAGWRDLFCDATIRAFEQLDAPKKLVVGPWMHTFPNATSEAPIDFPALALRWWDHWLGGRDTGFMAEPAVTAYVQGSPAPWRQFASWPPKGDVVVLTVGSDRSLQPGAEAACSGAECGTDPTVGTASGLWGMAAAGVGLPVDQHADDHRSLAADGPLLEADVHLAGRGEVVVTFSEPGHTGRLTARLSHVDEQGRSNLITLGAAPAVGGRCTVTLTPTAYRVPKGHRLRLAIADADFPRLWPAATAGTICPTSITLALPLVADDVGSVVELPPPPPLLAPAPMLAVRAEPRWTVSRDHIRDAVTVTFGQTLQAFTPNRQHLLETVTDLTAHVAPDAPAAATMTGVSTATARMATGETVTVRIDLRMTAHLLALRAEVGVDGSTVFNQAWHV